MLYNELKAESEPTEAVKMPTDDGFGSIMGWHGIRYHFSQLFRFCRIYGYGGSDHCILKKILYSGGGFFE
ncbi:MAG: hypothetical protein SV239_06780 [Thermodesulfobacteriota bacterium]|nr:hypothetical protein [Thermodesulfobacteriota bacterium]